ELDSVQQSIPEDTTVIEYFSTNDEVLAFVISRNNAQVFRRLAPLSRIQTIQERLAFQLEKFLLGEEFVRVHSDQIFQATVHYLQALDKIFLAPLVQSITTTRLIIIPHGTMHSLPFHAFFNGATYLIDRFEVTYAPSASVFRYCMDKPDIS